MPWTCEIVMNSSINLAKSSRINTVRLITEEMGDTNPILRQLVDIINPFLRSEITLVHDAWSPIPSLLIIESIHQREWITRESTRTMILSGRIQNSEVKWKGSNFPFVLFGPTCQHELELFTSWSHSTSLSLSLTHSFASLPLCTQECEWTLELERED
jgi:hypothetical protein